MPHRRRPFSPPGANDDPPPEESLRPRRVQRRNRPHPKTQQFMLFFYIDIFSFFW